MSVSVYYTYTLRILIDVSLLTCGTFAGCYQIDANTLTNLRCIKLFIDEVLFLLTGDAGEVCCQPLTLWLRWRPVMCVIREQVLVVFKRQPFWETTNSDKDCVAPSSRRKRNITETESVYVYVAKHFALKKCRGTQCHVQLHFVLRAKTALA